MKVFITGATGFIGGAVARRLRARGDEVIALARSPRRAAELEKIGCRIVNGDLNQGILIEDSMTGCDGVVHGAAVYDVGIPKKARPAMWDANVKGTETVLGAALRKKVKKVVYISTINAFGNTHGQVVDETHQHDEKFVSYYDETKFRAHQVARRLIEQGLPAVIVQPGGVYGPGDPSVLGTVMHQFLAGRLPALMYPESGFNLVHVDDLADGIVLALDKGRPGEAYVLGGELTTLGDAIATLARVAGKKAPRLTVPGAALKVIAPLGPLVGPLMGFGPNLREMITAADGVTYWATDAKAREELGYTARPLEQGLRDTLQAEGRLPA